MPATPDSYARCEKILTRGAWPVFVGFCLAFAACSTDPPAATGSRVSGSKNVSGSSGGAEPASATTVGSTAATPANPSSGGLILSTSGTGAVGVTPRVGAGNDETCASGMQTTAPITPTVWLVIDGSSSMDQGFGGGDSRWRTLRSTLMDPGGVVDSLQASVRFGMVIYSGGDPANCVQLVTVDPAPNNLNALSAQYPMGPLGRGTPTDKALEIVVNNLSVLNMGTLDMSEGPVYVVLATDGAPNDNCGGGGFGFGQGTDVEQRVVDIAAEGTRNGMQMFVISMAGDDTRLQAHLDMVANATASQTPPYAPATQDDLIAAFQAIVGGASCLVSLDGSVEVGRECGGSVQLNSAELGCNDANGWTLFDQSTVQLTGSACEEFRAHQSMVVANFPCEIFSPN